MDFPEIRSSRYPYNMAPWCIEKSEHVVRSLARMAETIRHSTSIPPEEKETLESAVGGALWDATKLLAFSAGAGWRTDDSTLVLERGDAGYEELLVRYGMRKETSEGKRARERDEFVAAVREALDLPKSEARPRIHELLARHPMRSSAYERLADLTERLTMGEISWDDYRTAVDTPLSGIEYDF